MTPAYPIDTNGGSEHPDGDESKTAIPQNHRDQQRALQCAAEEIAGGAGQGAGDPASFGIEVGNLENWARAKGTLIPASSLDSLPLVSNSTSEHEVLTISPRSLILFWLVSPRRRRRHRRCKTRQLYPLERRTPPH